MKCPKCGFEQIEGGTECVRCGIIFARLSSLKEKSALTRPAPPGEEVIKSPLGTPDKQSKSPTPLLIVAPRKKKLTPQLLGLGLVVILVIAVLSIVKLVPRATENLARQSEERAQSAALDQFGKPYLADESHSTHKPAPAMKSFPGQEEYFAGRTAGNQGRFEESIQYLEEAVTKNPALLEAWYDLGASRTRLAIIRANEDLDDEALSLIRSAFDAKQTAHDLIQQNKWTLWTESWQQNQVISDLNNALEDADEIYHDDETLLSALRLWGS
ncbi:hypothetical protein ACFL27_17830 [candidate division CSSED10-310 bacterium]|uniref:Tetratricopeptide repeat protein n=1 Tax=candidate division CSSED10-310 bacterium TaxID=2855610 RepID=A0ABV6Z0T7_UNCC1